MPLSAPAVPASAAARLASIYRLLVVTLLGFASGLPLALTGQALQAWLSTAGLDVAAIGFMSLVGLPYTFKFLWAPLMDRFELPWLGRRRGWLVLTQLLLAGALLLLAATSPTAATRAFALLAVAVAFLSASQDVVIDAYRTDLLPQAQRGMGASLNVMGYRLAMILSGGIALIWTDPNQGGGWSWPEVYRVMAGLMVAAAVISAVALPRIAPVQPTASAARQDLIGFTAVLLAVAAGYLLTDRFAPPLAAALLTPALEASSLSKALQQRWIDLLALLLGIAFTLTLAAWAARRARFETLLGGLANYFSHSGAAAFLVFIVLYKLGDAFAGCARGWSHLRAAAQRLRIQQFVRGRGRSRAAREPTLGEHAAGEPRLLQHPRHSAEAGPAVRRRRPAGCSARRPAERIGRQAILAAR